MQIYQAAFSDQLWNLIHYTLFEHMRPLYGLIYWFQFLILVLPCPQCGQGITILYGIFLYMYMYIHGLSIGGTCVDSLCKRSYQMRWMPGDPVLIIEGGSFWMLCSSCVYIHSFNTIGMHKLMRADKLRKTINQWTVNQTIIIYLPEQTWSHWPWPLESSATEEPWLRRLT